MRDQLYLAARFWLGNSFNRPASNVFIIECEYGLNEDNEGDVIMPSPYLQTRANFCLLIREAIKGD